MAQLMKRVEELCRPLLHHEIILLANELEEWFGTGAVETEDSRIVISGRGLQRRWLTDPRLRFIREGMK